jgi:hypothetical protein
MYPRVRSLARSVAIATTLMNASCASDDGPPRSDPAKTGVAFVPLRRLTNRQYERTLRDLMGVDVHPTATFPPDAVAYGFDDIGEKLTVSSLLVEKYDLAANEVIAAALAVPEGPPAQTFQIEDLGVEGFPMEIADGDGAIAQIFWTSSLIAVDATVDAAGQYSLAVRAGVAGGEGNLGATANVELSVDDQVLAAFTVDAPAMSPSIYSVEVDLTPGTYSLGLRYVDGSNEPPGGPGGFVALGVDYMKLSGPLGVEQPPSASRAAIVTCDPAQIGDIDCATEILGRFARRAFRRPLTDDETARLVDVFVDAEAGGADFEGAIRAGLHAVLLSPSFLFRIEDDPDPALVEPHPLTSFELTTRLSYLVWGSTPDDELLACADQGVDAMLAPSGECSVDAQVERMLADPRSEALIKDFAGRWFELDLLDSVNPDPSLYSWDEALRNSARTETELFFREFVDQPHPLLDLLDARFSYLDKSMAAHYGLSEPGGGDFARRALGDGDHRAGLLTQASILALTSHATRTSPTRRGKWVLGQILCQEPPPPPPSVPQIQDGQDVRSTIEAHTNDPVCAACHSTIDPYGFSLENYDAVGAFRTESGGQTVNASAKLPDGTTWEGASGLAATLRADPATAWCMVSKLYTYGMGRPMTPLDDAELEAAIEQGTLDQGFRALLRRLVHSHAFTHRRPEGASQ